MKTLSVIELPLNCTALIEASAGTGKTFTMANLYLRLLLGVGCSPLTVAQILVVTFTKAATEELRDRIRKNIKACRTFLQDYDAEQSYAPNDFFCQLYQQIQSVEEAILRLRIAEREIDLASIFTIHSFCQKMLFQFAFDSGARFDNDLQPDESDLLRRLSEEVWREMFYPMALNETAAVAEYLCTPENALGAVRALISAELPLLSNDQHWLSKDLATHLRELQHFLLDAKQHWLECGAEVIMLIEAELAKKYKTGEKKALNRRSYQTRYLAKWRSFVDEWATSSLSYLPEEYFERFCQDFIIEKAEQGADPLVHAHFVKNQQILTAYQQRFANKQKPLLLYQFLLALRRKLVDYKATHSEKSFNDMLTLLNQALKGERGEVLAEQIRGQFPFAMIDEFQDTDKEQYEIFQKIFMQEKHMNQGFIMIGDPKQSIYKFRGADIFTYLTASRQAQEERTLAKNWRSLPPIVTAINRLFEFPESASNSPFLYEGIQFHCVASKESRFALIGSAYVNCYLQEKFDEKLAAKQCAYQIQQQLKQMEAGEFGLETTQNTTGSIEAFQAKDMAILVRSHSQATLIKNALAELSIRSVFLSEKESVYQSKTAKELLWVLYACLNPYHQTNLLNALGTFLWGLSAVDIHQLKNNELQWDEQVGRFIAYQQIWRQQGILPMLHKLFMQEGIVERLRSNPTESDRRLTDLLHLTELLQNAMPSLENESALVRWYERQLSQINSMEEHILRLESEEELIKIVTIHGAKGLQYPIVWLPFIGKKSQGGRSSNLAIYRDEQGQPHWCFGKPTDDVQMLLDREELAEDLRLLYVAMTRAESQINLILPQRFEAGWNAVHYLLSNGEIGLDKTYKAEISTAAYLKRKGIDCQAIELSEKMANDEWRPTPFSAKALSACPFAGHIQQTGLVTSFSALHQQHECATQNQVEYNMPKVFENAGQDYDQQMTILEADNFLVSDNEELNAYLPYQFPHSTKVGNILHSFFEHCDFQQAVNFEQIITICEQLDLDEHWYQPLQQWFEKILVTPFAETAFALKDIPATKRLNEWQFYLRLKNLEGLRKLNQLLKQYSPVSAKLPDLSLPQLEGYIRGFVDCIVQMNDKFYLIDYKSNFLGYLPQDYSRQNLQKTIGQYRYDLQYLLYTLALHRYLRVRLGERYEYERDFGGVAYLFLRGMDGTPNSGVFFEKPCKALIENMDELFG